MARAFSINLFLKDGDPEGLRIITQLNKTGVGVVFNRSTFAESRKDEKKSGSVFCNETGFCS